MKKLSFLIIVLLATCTIALAQPRAIGGRLSYSIGVSYQHSFGEKNMLQLDLEFPGFMFGAQATATYNWIFPIKSWTGPGSWNLYAGVGAGAGFNWWSAYGWAGVAGMFGAEYNFKFPLQLFADFRPVIGPSFGRNYVGFDLWPLYSNTIGIGARYRF